MNVFLWIVAGVLAAFFLGAGFTKLSQSKAKLGENPQMGWTKDFSAGTLKLIGAAEVLGALGLILPGAFDIAPILVPLAASGLAIIMAGAIITHARRKEYPVIGINTIVLILALVVAIFRFGPNSF
ncbi:DoxX family protein [Streptomyces sp. SID13031]|uniref:DoxX family protein n=1 Tax=Streptomyces sp. SID13031 TaxID=2706046 RepID=UPI0013C6D00A|nr:DoxX family protein [Streptomyces sp. SID13031]NEA31304.1 DoxX family protein [Streptomyces sp. SID13031]